MDEEIRQALSEVREMKQMCGNINMKLTNIVTQRGQNWKAKLEAEYQRGLEDAWEAAKKIFGYEIDGGIPIDKIGRVFGYSENETFCTADIIRHNTASEAIAKLKAYEEKQKEDDKIEVGDVVERYLNDKLDSTGIYLGEDGDYWNCLFWTGAVFGTFAYPKNQFKKTGRHFDIASILEDMRND